MQKIWKIRENIPDLEIRECGKYAEQQRMAVVDEMESLAIVEVQKGYNLRNGVKCF